MPIATSAEVLRSITVALPPAARARFVDEGIAGRQALARGALEHLAAGWALERLVAELVPDDMAGAKSVTAVVSSGLRALPLAPPAPEISPVGDGAGEAAVARRRAPWAAWARTLLDVEDLDDEQRVEALELRGVDDPAGVLTEARASLGLTAVAS